MGGDGFGSHDEDDHFLAATRRSATAVAAGMPEEPMTTTLGGFTWGARREEPEAREEQPRSRTALIGGIALVAILAIAAGVVLSQRLGGTHKILQLAPAANTAPVSVKPVEAPKPAAQTEPKPNALALPPATTKPAAKALPTSIATRRTTSCASLRRLPARLN